MKGIEKEGSAEFKVFGKEHTLSLDSPSTKATDVPARDPAKTGKPTQTADKSKPTCSAKAKRAGTAAVETKQIYDDTAKFKILANTAKSEIANNKWVDGMGWAIENSEFPFPKFIFC